MKLIVGLGNPGEKYRYTPHNMGFLVVEQIARQHKALFRKNYALAESADFRLGRERVILVKPLTYMNLSGTAVREILKAKRAKPDSLLVICDDINLPLGRIRARRRGSDGGHLGLSSIIEKIETQNFSRLRVGVGRPGIKDVCRYVLERFCRDDSETAGRIVETAASAALTFIKEGIDEAMNRFN